LTAALVYLHDRSIRHKDIKPQNILIHNGTVILTDFGLSHDFADDVGSTTSGPTPASPRYSAPEVAAHEARNTSADIWSLGCVFFEMAAALRGFNIDWVKSYFTSFYTMSPYFHANLGSLNHLLQEWYGFGPAKDTKPLLWIGDMLRVDRMLRPTAAEVLDFITSTNNPEETVTSFCGICCLPCYESDSCDSLADEPPDYSTPARPPIAESQFQHGRLESHVYPQEHRQARSSTFLAPEISEPNLSSYPTPLQNPQHLTDRTVVHHTLRPIKELVPEVMAYHLGSPPPYIDTAPFTARDMQGVETRAGNDLARQIMAQFQTYQMPGTQPQQRTIQPNNLQASHIDSIPAPPVVSTRPHDNSEADRDELSKEPNKTTPLNRGDASTIKEAEKDEKKGDEQSKQDMEAKLEEFNNLLISTVPVKSKLPLPVENEKEEDAEKSKQDKQARLNEFKSFASRFKLHTPIPADLVPILANNEDKQRELVIKALEAARKSRGEGI
jgi:serine/threonine protein kinase